MSPYLKVSSVGFQIILTCLVMSSCSNQPAKDVVVTPLKDTVTVTADIKKDTVATSQVKTDTVARMPLTVIVNNLVSNTAPITIGLYCCTNKFLDPKDELKEYKFVPKGDVLTAKITDLNYGEFAMAIYQDVNDNGKIDKNLIGIPTEPYAFSNNYKPKVKAPAFKDCVFSYNKDTNTVTMKLIK
ncbi:MAG: hypothetical protein JWO06_3987 [Bacteroidota bacterium]|nr:hypothetical protein [Bacteroidota bacterium]